MFCPVLSCKEDKLHLGGAIPLVRICERVYTFSTLAEMYSFSTLAGVWLLACPLSYPPRGVRVLKNKSDKYRLLPFENIEIPKWKM